MANTIKFHNGFQHRTFTPSLQQIFGNNKDKIDKLLLKVDVCK